MNISATYKSICDQSIKYVVLALGAAISFSTSLTIVLSALLLLLWCINDVKSKISCLYSSKVTFAILFFLGLYVIGIIYSDGITKDIMRTCIKISRLLLIPIIMSLTLEEKWRERALYGFWFITFINLLIILGVIFNIITFHNRVGGIGFKDSIFTSLFVSFTIFSLLHYAMEKPKFRVFGFALATLFFVYLYFYCTGRTGQIVGVGLILLFMLQRKINKYEILTLCLCLLLILSMFFNRSKILQERYKIAKQQAQEYFANKVENVESSSVGLRLDFVKNSIKLVPSAPFIGHGTGSFHKNYMEKFPKLDVLNPHNQYILTLVELGSFGLLSLLCMFAVMWYASYSLPTLDKFCAQGLIFSIMVGGLFNSWLLDCASMYYFVYFAGIFFTATLLPNKQKITSS